MQTLFVPQEVIEEGKRKRNINFDVPLSLEEDPEQYLNYTLSYLVLQTRYPHHHPYFSLHKEEGKCYGFPRPHAEDYPLMQKIAQFHGIGYEELMANVGFYVTFPPFTNAQDLSQEAKHQLQKLFKAMDNFYAVLIHPSYEQIKNYFTQGLEELIAIHLAQPQNEKKKEEKSTWLYQQP